jgi:hypothetical protein
MNPGHRERWESEIRTMQGTLKKPAELLRRAASPEDFVDSAVLGGVSVAGVVAGNIAESQIPANVTEAFHAQYPHFGSSFVEAVQHLSDDPERLMGLVNGVKGKLFELDYLEWLNQGHLPAGMVADLAHSANNPGWDIVIHDAEGHIDHLLQLKATNSISYVHEAIAAHPDVDVVVTHELYQRLADDHSALAHLLDGHEALAQVNGHIADAVGHVEAAGAAEHLPIVGPALVVCLASLLSYQEYRTGRVSVAEALRNVGERGVLAILATGAGWFVHLAAHSNLAALPATVSVRLLGGQFLHNRKRRELLGGLLQTIECSRIRLQRQLIRPLLPPSTQLVSCGSAEA